MSGNLISVSVSYAIFSYEHRLDQDQINQVSKDKLR